MLPRLSDTGEKLLIYSILHPKGAFRVQPPRGFLFFQLRGGGGTPFVPLKDLIDGVPEEVGHIGKFAILD